MCFSLPVPDHCNACAAALLLGRGAASVTQGPHLVVPAVRSGAMRAGTGHPKVLQLFPRHWLHALERSSGRTLGLAEVPDAELDRIAALGFDLVYLLGVWTLGNEGPELSRSMPELRAEYDRCLPGWRAADV